MVKIGLVGNIKKGLGTRILELSKVFMKQGSKIHIIPRVAQEPLHSVRLSLKTFSKRIKKKAKKLDLDLLYIMGEIGEEIEEIPVVCREASSTKEILDALRCLNIDTFDYTIFHKLYNRCVTLHWEKKMVRASDIVTTASEDGKSWLQSYIDSPNEKDKIKVVPGGVNTSHFSFQRDTRERNSDEKFKILYVGRIEWLKGITFLLEAIDRLRDHIEEKLICYLVGGHVPYQISKLINALNISKNIKVIGSISYRRMPNIYSQMDVLVHPSLLEGTPLVVMEAMATGLPVVATDVGGTSTFVKNQETGMLIPPFSKEAIVNSVLTIKENSALVERMRIRARELMVNEFNWRVIAGKVKEIFVDLLK